MNHIVIEGFMGSGKSRVGKKLSKDLGIPFVDLDKEIAKRMKMSIKDIFNKFGEPFYRALETMSIKEFAKDKERKVISLGYSLPVQAQNKKYIKDLGTVIYLKGSFEVLYERIVDNDPAYAGEAKETRLKQRLKNNEPAYAGCADITVITGVKSFEDLIKEIEEKLDEYTKNS